MRKLKYLCFLFLIYNFAQSQEYEYIPFPTKSAIWKYKKITDKEGLQESYLYYYQNGDTVINNLTYKKLYYYEDLISNVLIYIGGLREEDKRIYLCQSEYFEFVFELDCIEDTSYITEEVLYDFNPKLGDTLNLRSHCFTEIIHKETYQYFLGKQRRSLTFILNNDDNWYEGIGSNMNLIHPITFFSVGIGTFSIECFKTDVDHFELIDCTVDIEEKTKPEIKIYYDYENYFIDLQGLNEIPYWVNIFDLQGRLLIKRNIENNAEISFPKSQISAGINIIQIVTNQNIYSKKIINK